jgi:hypothetical protein
VSSAKCRMKASYLAVSGLWLIFLRFR